MKHRQPGLFDVEERAAQLTKMGDSLMGRKPGQTGKRFGLNSNEYMKRTEKVRRALNRSMSC